jgi:acylphosphatase
MSTKRHKSNERIARRYWISGRVQGVGFRAFAERVAHELGVTGWARNLADGGVEVHANGTAQQLDELESRLRQGPRWSDVRGFDVKEVAVLDTSGFYIR